ncbi:FAD:protein FMN transferase [Sphingobium sufflavum]|uniref:FAD:protein FMN transferase n=1 Tax=Sphingobium sufflavum TaxID=1129547 RepID=UPI001F348109|nr:FAD:protein FMN transferase [Sphingobium sufflavum]MCE7796916.1 FAD:protein FMN transferase [Sphingobium sufflavum]
MASAPTPDEQERRVFLPPVMPEDLEIPDGEWLRLSGAIFGTGWQVDVVRDAAAQQAGDDARWLEALRGRIADTLETIDAQMSPWRDASDLMRFNRAGDGERFPLPEPMRTVVAHAITVADQSGGAFDPTLHDAVSLWGFSATAVAQGLPDAERLSAIAATRRDWRDLGFDGTAIIAREGLTLDLCAIAKGFAVDAAMAVIRADPDARSALVEIGGELKGWGVRPDGMPWWVGIEQPGDDAEPVVAALCDWAVATSGDYLRTFHHDGVDYCHAIDPRTLAPVRSGVASATVFDRACWRADALATALMVMGAERAQAFADAQAIPCLLGVRTDGGGVASHMSAAMRDWLDDDD